MPESRLPVPFRVLPWILQERVRVYTALPGNHPAKISSRAYGLALLLSLGPTLLPFVSKVIVLAKTRKDVDHVGAGKVAAGLWRLLRRELGPFGFAFAITTAVAGGSFLANVSENLERPVIPLQDEGASIGGGLGSAFGNAKSRLWRCCTLSDIQRTFLSNALASAVAIVLLQWKAPPGRPLGVPELPLTLPIDDTPRPKGISPTLNLTLFLLVRALDSVVHGGLQDRLLQKLKGKGREVTPGPTSEVEGATSRDSVYARNWINKWSSNLDSLLFCVCSARVIWCFFYKPNVLPKAYVKWISRLADLDPRVIRALQSVRDGSLSYHGRYAASPDLAEFAEELGYPASWGDFSVVPGYGTDATSVWKKLGVEGRNGIGGIPCELVHGGNEAGNSCGKNLIVRGRDAWLAATLIYLPAHLLPVIVKRPRDLISPERLISILLGVTRSATFLSAFVQLMWLGVCSTRTFLIARLFPWVSHDYFDGPYGCIFVASLICGSSIWIEHPRRRGEITLYVLPRAIRTVLSDSWLKGGRRRVQFAERIAFVASLSTLLTSAIHRPESLRGLSKWAVNYVLKGPSSLT